MLFGRYLASRKVYSRYACHELIFFPLLTISSCFVITTELMRVTGSYVTLRQRGQLAVHLHIRLLTEDRDNCAVIIYASASCLATTKHCFTYGNTPLSPLPHQCYPGSRYESRNVYLIDKKTLHPALSLALTTLNARLMVRYQETYE